LEVEFVSWWKEVSGSSISAQRGKIHMTISRVERRTHGELAHGKRYS